MFNILTVDVEEYFHASELSVDPQTWTHLPTLVEFQTNRVLDLLAARGVKGTFFVLGWVAENHPRLIRKIAAAGHEIACHGYAHRLIFDLTPVQFRTDTVRALVAIEDACGITPCVYRAASFSITARSFWALEILAECGFTHDSSVYPIVHDRYGIPGFGRHAQQVWTASGSICEVPIATVKLSERRYAPTGGGAYMRLLPYRYTAAGIRRMNDADDQPACIYVHPWELDPDLPRMARGVLSGIRSYAGLSGMENKLKRLLQDFQFSTLTSVHPATATSGVLPESELAAASCLP